MSTPMQCLLWNQKNRARNDGIHLRTIGVATMKPARQSMPMQAYCFHMNEAFGNCSDKDEIYPITTVEIAEAQRADVSLNIGDQAH